MLKFRIFICLLLFYKTGITQNDTVFKKQSPNIFVSAGLHAGFLNLGGITVPPSQIQADVNLINNFFMGLGYSYDKYPATQILFLYRSNETIRQNIRMRIYNYFGSYKKQIMAYSGCSMGLSIWDYKKYSNYQNYFYYNVNYRYLPSFQILFGLKSTIYKNIFNITEIGIGSPYFMQTSFGYKF